MPLLCWRPTGSTRLCGIGCESTRDLAPLLDHWTEHPPYMPALPGAARLRRAVRATRDFAASRATLVGAEEQPAALLNLLLLMPAAALARPLMQDPTHAAQAALVLA